MATSGATPPAGCSFDRGCIFGQKNLRSVKTNCPADFKRADVGCGYKSLADTIMEGFAKLGELPSGETFWDEGNYIKATCYSHQACWHIKCRHRFLHSTKLERLQKGQADVNNSASVECEADAYSSTDSNPVDPPSKIPRLTRRETIH